MVESLVAKREVTGIASLTHDGDADRVHLPRELRGIVEWGVVISRMYARDQMREAELRFSVSAGSAQECLQNAEQYVRHVLGPGATEPWLKSADLRARTPVEYAAEITYAFFDHDDE